MFAMLRKSGPLDGVALSMVEYVILIKVLYVTALAEVVSVLRADWLRTESGCSDAPGFCKKLSQSCLKVAP